MSSKLPSKKDPERSKAEKQALKTKEKVTQVAEAFNEGKLPNTEQITETIGSIQESDVIHDSARDMSPLGKKVFADTEKLLETTKNLLEEKNAGDEMQNIIYHGGKASRDIAESTSIPIPHDLTKKFESHAEASKPMSQDVFQKTMKIPQLLISSSEFRKLVNDIHEIIQELLIDPASGQKQKGEVREGSEGEKSPKEALQQTAAQARGSTYPVAKEAAATIEPHLKEFSEGRKSMQQATTEGIKTLSTDFKEKFGNYHLSPEKREKLVTRFKNVMIDIQKKPEYQESLSEIVHMVSRISDFTKELATRVNEPIAQEAAKQKDSLSIAQRNAKELLEKFANNYSLDKLISLLKEMGDKINHDVDLRNHLKEVQNFVLCSLSDSDFIQKHDYKEYGSRLIQDSRHFLLERYSETMKAIAKEIKNFNEALQEDKTTAQWRSDFEALISDVFLDEKGRPTFKFELIKDFGKILPLVAEKLKFIPLPRIENSDDQYDYIFDNIVLHVAEIVPKHIHFSFNSDINLERGEDDIVQNTVLIEISKLCADARNIAFYYKKKSGLISMKDVGLVDFSIPSEGLNICIKLLLSLPTDKESNTQFDVLEAEANIKELKLRLHETRHDFLYTFLTPLVEKRLKRQLEEIMNNYIRKSLEYLKENLAKLRQKVDEMQTDSQENPLISHQKHEQRKEWESRAFNMKRKEE
ncbi:hypothetical protein Glove_88g26 [Diversispora epigaea]|uniref:Uncharacterized protein n=1 Tax=Diversispora epigaea TaxID=1348612 RepID=A0A397J6I3_9GLOM|nr:hypothetical protein Glove_88g26 [Diversispora epigaea]